MALKLFSPLYFILSLLCLSSVLLAFIGDPLPVSHDRTRTLTPLVPLLGAGLK